MMDLTKSNFTLRPIRRATEAFGESRFWWRTVSMLLALKTIFSSEQGVTSIIFDEVDTGVSGRVAQAIADKISQISKYSQVLCITHLPQVAAVADYQYYIVKAVIDGRTQTSVSELKTKEREEEIARMLAGSEITKLTLEHAKNY